MLAGLRDRLMDPDLFKDFADAFVAEWNLLQGARCTEAEARVSELDKVRRQIGRMVDAIADGTPVAALRDRLDTLEARRLELEAETATTASPAPRLHPNLAAVYREKVATLIEALGSEDGAEARELVRGLVEHITLYPEGTSQRVEVRGELAEILALSQGARGVRSGEAAGDLSVQVKMVAGTGFEPVTFRL